MSLNRILSIVVAAVAVAAAVSVSLVAAAVALYAFVLQWLGPVGSAALVAGVFALLALFAAAIAVGKIRPRRGSAPPPPPSPVEKIFGIARERPILATGAAVLAGLVLMRNPAIMTTLITAFLAGGGARPGPPPKSR